MATPSVTRVQFDALVLLLFGVLCSLVGGVTHLVPDLFDSGLLLWGGFVVGTAGLCWYAFARLRDGR
ncbi:hypothetical protein [Halorarum halobium]|uniref:hypothetical protein n=1 Tax=Halorarum halobium TaxID=3075121 RepID=UPI0028B26320|nr:hypothetical protein [Halobaculum sp. XH14]